MRVDDLWRRRTRPRLGSRSAGRVGGTGNAVALLVGVVGVGSAVAVLIGVIALIGSGDGATAGALDVPIGRSVAVVTIGYAIALALVALTLRSASIVGAWVAAVAATVIAWMVSIYPLVATAAVAVDQARDIVPWILGLLP